MWQLVSCVSVLFGLMVGYTLGKYGARGRSPTLAPHEEWEYLGQSTYSWIRKGTKDVVHQYVIQFWGIGPNYKRRKTVRIGAANNMYDLDDHENYTESVPRWLAGDNLWTGIMTPSETFISYTEKKTRYTFNSSTKTWEKMDPVHQDPKMPEKPTEDLVDAILNKKE